MIGTIASLSMGVADFPIEIFRKAKTGTEAMKARSNTMKENSTDDRDSRSSSEVELNKQGTFSPTSATSGTMSPRAPSSIAGFSKTSYESTGRSSTELGSIGSSSTNPTTISFDDGSTNSASTKPAPVRGSSLKEALRGTVQRARSLSRDRGSTSRSDSRDPSLRTTGTESPGRHSRKDSNTVFDPSKMTIDNAGRATKGIGRIVSAGMKSPMDFTLGIARGFHNAPKLYGDDTVRPQEKVTDFQSGLKAAGKVICLVTGC